MSNQVHETAEVEGVEMDPTARIYKHASVKNSHLAANVKVGDFARIADSRFARNVDLQRFSMIYGSEMGDYSYVGRNFTCWHAKIGKFCSISWNVSIGGANHDYTRMTQHSFLYAPQFGLLESDGEVAYDRFTSKCEIGNDVWIGCHAVILRDVKIGDGAVVAAGSVVTKDVEPYTIVAGVPAKVIKRRCSPELAKRMQDLAWWDMDVHVVKQNLRLWGEPISEEAIIKMECLKKI